MAEDVSMAENMEMRQDENEQITKADEATGNQTDAKSEAQKMADAIVAKKLKGMPTKEELAEFKTWKETQKAPEPEENEEVKRLRDEAAKNAAKVLAYERKELIIGADVAPEFVDYVSFQVGQKVSDETDFETALSEFIKQNPQYKGQTATRTQLEHGAAPTNMGSSNEKMNALIRGTKGEK